MHSTESLGTYKRNQPVHMTHSKGALMVIFDMEAVQTAQAVRSCISVKSLVSLLKHVSSIIFDCLIWLISNCKVLAGSCQVAKPAHCKQRQPVFAGPKRHGVHLVSRMGHFL